MDIYGLSGKLGRDPKKADGTSMEYQEQCAYIAGCLDVWFSLFSTDRVTLDEISEAMQMSRKEVQRMYVMWIKSVL